MRKKVYISGKIGEEVLSDATREKFAKAEEYIKAKGYKVFNPTTSGLGTMADAYAKAWVQAMVALAPAWMAGLAGSGSCSDRLCLSLSYTLKDEADLFAATGLQYSRH